MENSIEISVGEPTLRLRLLMSTKFSIYKYFGIEQVLILAVLSMTILEKWFPLWGEQAHSLKLFCMYDKRFEI